jgi:hypothetical protein
MPLRFVVTNQVGMRERTIELQEVDRVLYFHIGKLNLVNQAC